MGPGYDIGKIIDLSQTAVFDSHVREASQPITNGRYYTHQEQATRAFHLARSLGPVVPPDRFLNMSADFWHQAGRELFPPVHERLLILTRAPVAYKRSQEKEQEQREQDMKKVLDTLNDVGIPAIFSADEERVLQSLEVFARERLVIVLGIHTDGNDGIPNICRYLLHELDSRGGMPMVIDEQSYADSYATGQLLRSFVAWHQLRTIPMHAPDFAVELILRSLPKDNLPAENPIKA